MCRLSHWRRKHVKLYQRRILSDNTAWEYCMRILRENTVWEYCVRMLCENIEWEYCVRMLCENIEWEYCMRIMCENAVWEYWVRILGEDTVWEYCVRILDVPRSEVLCDDTGHSVSVIQTSQLTLYREIIAVCSQIHTKHINTAVWAERGTAEC